MNDVIRRLRGEGYEVRTRKQWGSAHADVYAYRLRTKPVDFPVDHMFAHITVTSQNGDEGARQVEDIGMDRFGSGVSYQWLVDHETHAIYEGQPLAAKGTHTVNDKKVPGFPVPPESLNYVGHAVAFMGVPGDEFCGECAELFAAIMAASKIEGVVREEARYLPHSMFAAKECPTEAIREMLPIIHREASRMVRTSFGNEPRETRVARIKDELEKLLAELDKVPAKRKKVHKAKDEAKAAVEKLPER